ncbi:S9 family peptidase [Flavobacterium sp. LS1P28]|uniref:S9 family peptidase n=1 Tax=Flavobacterium sp. LS1P28 TaxID=2497752 RepID=UPI000F83AF3B|nr:prolyl oligopeptidase family serine peptidase [Flavobacterium sp. LS1P28]RTY78845.1 S9 family peptidase [Flavobacterium sp. LS1P28]
MLVCNRTFRGDLPRVDFILSFLFALLACPLSGQVAQKRQLTAADYHLWNTLSLETISKNGDWLSYRLVYEDSDTLFVKSSNGTKTFRFPKGTNGQFFSETHFLCQGKDHTLSITNLKSEKLQLFKEVKSYTIMTNYIIIEQNKTLLFFDLSGRLLYSVSDVGTYAVNPDGKSIAYTTESNSNYSLNIITVRLPVIKTMVVENDDSKYEKLTWSKEGTALVFLQQGTQETSLHYYRPSDKSVFSFRPGSNKSFPLDMNIVMTAPLTISEDGQRVFFKIRKRPATMPVDVNDVQVWNTADKWIYPAEKQIDGWKKTAKLAMWEPANKRFLQITDTLLPLGMLTADGRYAITYNPQQYEPQFKLDEDRDLYRTDLLMAGKKQWLKKQSSDQNHMIGSPNGKHIAYFREKQWFIYDITKETHTQIRIKKDIPLFNIDHDLPYEAPAYGNPGWSTNDGSILVYDQYDLWEIKPDGSNAKRLTNGREKEIIFRIIPQTANQKMKFENGGWTGGEFNLSDELVLQATAADHSNTGFYLLKKGNPLKLLTYGSKKTTTILKSSGNETFAWFEESYEHAPKIIVKRNNEKPRVLVQSNNQQKDFFWSKPELLDYISSEGKTLHGILYYPANYQRGVKYPMIVHIYEKQSQYLFDYINPSLYNCVGFNVSNLTAKGYFVLLPDIEYKIGEVGSSALDCVEASVHAVLKKGDVDDGKIGLIGHSFGGFQTDYIITKSKLFACAVAGSAITNIVSWYLSVAYNTNQPNAPRVESGQTRMVKSLYEDMDIYLKNSPVLLADDVNTPLLSWTGLRDFQVNTTQSFEFYMALRRLGKRHIMLGYPDEEHGIEGREHDKDLTTRIEAWFDYYLKDIPAPDWMIKQ